MRGRLTLHLALFLFCSNIYQVPLLDLKKKKKSEGRKETKKASCDLPLIAESRPSFSAWNAGPSLPNSRRPEGLRPAACPLAPCPPQVSPGAPLLLPEPRPGGPALRRQDGGEREPRAPQLCCDAPLSWCFGVPSLPPWAGRRGTPALPPQGHRSWSCSLRAFPTKGRKLGSADLGS